MAKILMMAASLRKGSLNKKFIRAAHELVAGPSELIAFEDFPMPVYDGDVEETSGIPSGVKALAEKIQNAEALIISTPEYNGSIPGPLKNALDWLSRLKPVPLKNKKLLLLGASPGALGAVRGLWHTRVPFEVLGVPVSPEMMGLPHADKAFTDAGKLSDSVTEEKLKKILQQFVEIL